jgi:hypothetical protein
VTSILNIQSEQHHDILTLPPAHDYITPIDQLTDHDAQVMETAWFTTYPTVPKMFHGKIYDRNQLYG